MPECCTKPSGIDNNILQSIAKRCQSEFNWIADSRAQRANDRAVAWIADCECPYVYNNKSYPSNSAKEWFTSFTHTIVKVAQLEHLGFNSCNLNWYKSGHNSLAWHQDDESLFRFSPQDVVPILSLSIGASRNFLLRKIGDSHISSVPLHNGDLLYMGGLLQTTHKHKVAPSTAADGEWRLNFTWRVVVNPPDI